MGLDIRAYKTDGHIGRGYHVLHMTARKLALLYCGMPEFIDRENKEPAYSIYMSGYTAGKEIDSQKMQQFIYACQISAIEFPNLLLHSDCEGTYTKRGKIALDNNLMTGNSIQLMKELEKLVNEKEFQAEKYKDEMAYTKDFYELVKKEVEEGVGRIIFH